jgi:hypothetical protein
MNPSFDSSTLVLGVYSRGFNLNAIFIQRAETKLGRTFSTCIILANREQLETSYKVYACVCPGYHGANVRYFVDGATRG